MLPQTSLSRACVVLLTLVSLSAWALPGGKSTPEALQHQDVTPPALKGIGVDERLGEQIPLDVELLDGEGRQVTLGQLLPGDKPLLLTLVYYDCPMLCNLVLNGLVTGLKDVSLKLGEDFHMVTVSVDPKDTPHQSLQRRRKHLQSMGHNERAPWHFLTGTEAEVRRLADAVGFRYNYDPDTKQYAHPAVVLALSPEGKVTRYLYGASFPAKDLRLAILEAGEGKIGTTLEKVVLSCFQYNPATQRYGFYIFGFLRLGALAILGVVATLLFVSWRREFKKGSAV